jgi:hypothetical protein
MSENRPFELLDDVKFDLCETLSNHPQRISRRIGNIDNSSRNVRAAVIDPNCYGPSTGEIRYTQPRAEWQRRMSGGQIVRIELFAARGLCSLCIEAGNSLRSSLCLGCMVVRRERGMSFCGRDTPVDEECCRSIVLQRRLSTGANKLGISGDDGGRLSAGRKQSPCQSDDKQTDGVPNGRGRVRQRVQTNTGCLTIDARYSGTADGRHVASPTRAPSQTQSDLQ